MSKENVDLQLSLAAQILWQQTPIQQRVEILQQWADQLSQHDETYQGAAKMIEFQCQQALMFVGPVHLLPGPTGESNELYCVGRGSFLIIGDDHADTIGIVGMISAALVAGNSVICCVDQNVHCDLSQLMTPLIQAGCPEHVTILASHTESESLAVQPLLAGVALVGSEASCIHYNQLLANRDGRLAQLIYETDLKQYSHLSQASLCLRFITERTRTINVTAIGGNATLLELGSGD